MNGIKSTLLLSGNRLAKKPIVEPSMSAETDKYWMQQALAQAEMAGDINEVPVGAVLVAGDKLIASGHNQAITKCDPSAHAEIVTLRLAGIAAQNYRLPNTTLYVTIEPCTMCFGAIIHSRVARLVYGAAEPKAGAVESQLQLAEQGFYNHNLEVEGGVLAEQCSQLISDFFSRRRQEKKRNT
jgi:tRNA(adenine34) deaminase